MYKRFVKDSWNYVILDSDCRPNSSIALESAHWPYMPGRLVIALLLIWFPRFFTTSSLITFCFASSSCFFNFLFFSIFYGTKRRHNWKKIKDTINQAHKVSGRRIRPEFLDLFVDDATFLRADTTLSYDILFLGCKAWGSLIPIFSLERDYEQG